jgi:hypothetical protein
MEMTDIVKKVLAVNDQKLSSATIAKMIGASKTRVSDIRLNLDLPRPKQWATGRDNPSFVCGRTIDRDGYVLIPADRGHPNARIIGNKKSGRILEHRHVMELHLGRYLDKKEVVDHKDECHLNNDIENLRIFPTNAHHLKETLKGRVPKWSSKGVNNFFYNNHQKDFEPVDTYDCLKKLGVVRLRQILLAHVLLGKDSPYLLGTNRYLEKHKIDLDHFLKSKMSPNEYLQLALGHQ